MRPHRMDNCECDLYDTRDRGSRDSRDTFDLYFHGFLQYRVERYPHRVSHNA
jgi:hypothetical protein